MGNVTSIADGVDPARSRSFDHHPELYFLECAAGPWQPGSTCNPAGGGPNEWTHDDISNRLTEKRGGQAADTYVYEPGAGGDAPILERIDLGAGGTRDYTFGEAGRLEDVQASGGEVDFWIDAAGRVHRISRPAGDAMVELSYDGRGFLSQAAEFEYALIFQDGFETGDTSCWSATVGGGATTAGTGCFEPGGPVTVPLYSSEGRLEMLEKQVDPSSLADRSYVFYLAGAPIAQLEILSGGAESWKFLTTDHLGTPIFVSDINGVEIWMGGFEPFGSDYSGAQAAGVFLRLPGQWDDNAWQGATEGVELYYNLHRWYEYGTGRYTRVDPAGVVFDPNVYPYASSRPTLFIDPLGLQLTSPILLPPPECFCAFEALGRNYRDMRRANWLDSDKYFHCKGNCEATRCGPSGEACACFISNAREVFDLLFKGDPPMQSLEDLIANAVGWSSSKANPRTACSVNCQMFRPRNLPAEF